MRTISEKVAVFFNDPRRKGLLVWIGVGGLLVLAIIMLVILFKGPSYETDLYIDSVATPVASQVERIRLDRPYYNQKVRKKTVAFYKKNGNKTRWLEYKRPTRFYRTFVKAIEHAAAYGLDPARYDLDNIRRDVEAVYKDKKREPASVAELDVRITISFFLFTTHLTEGRIRDAGYGDFIWNKHLPAENDVDLLLTNSSGELSDVIEQLHPEHDQYEKLRKALQQYRKFDDSYRIQLTTTPVDQIKPGDTHQSVPQIRRRICMTDIDRYEPDDSLYYDDRLAKGVKRFQKRHGLVDDGVIGPATLVYLRQSLRYKTGLIELNLERLRWRPKKYGPDYVSINIPEYLLRVFEGGKKKLEMKVVLGTEYNSTPVFSDTLEYIVFSPTWNVPVSIFEEEFLPMLQEDPSRFDPKRFVISKHGEPIDPAEEDWDDDDLDPAAYRMVESPGEVNSLGRVKFMMPNRYNIYLHDTPAARLFRKDKRAYSHGCIRVENPVEFAKLLLKENEEQMSDEEIGEAMQQEEPVTVPLKRKYPVEIEYRTVWVDDDGLLNFREDIYEHDRRQLAMLERDD